MDFCFGGGNYITKKVRVVPLARATRLLALLFIPTNNIKLSQTVRELWPAQDFGVSGDNYIMKTVRVISLVRDTPTGPFHSYQILSNYQNQ